MQDFEPVRSGALEVAALEAEMGLDFGADVDVIGWHVPVEDDVGGAGHGQGLTLDIGDRALREPARGEGVLHDGEADQHDDQHEAADQRRTDDVVRQRAGDRETRRADPGEQQEPCRDEHDRALVAMRREIDDQQEARARDGRERNMRDAGGDRGVVPGEPQQREQEDHPERHDMRGAHVPTVEIEVGEQKHHERGGQDRLGRGAPEPVGFHADAEGAREKAEVDADIGEDRPGERGGGGEDDRALDHDDDGEEQRQQAGNADDDALVERETCRAILVGVRVPEVELRQVGRAQLGDIGDGRAGIQRDAEDVGVRIVVGLRREALARRDRIDAHATEIGPDDSRSHQPEMWGDQQALDLLVGIVGEREHDPGRARAFLLGAHFDTTDDAIRTWSGRDLQAVALGRIGFDGARQVDRLGIERHAHGFDRVGRQAFEGQNQDGQKQSEKTHEFSLSGAAAQAKFRPGGAPCSCRKFDW